VSRSAPVAPGPSDPSPALTMAGAIGQALFECCVPALRGFVRFIDAPGVVLFRFCGLFDVADSRENSQDEQQKPHARHSVRNTRRGLADTNNAGNRNCAQCRRQ
jgi:hypothetical protein